MLFFQKRKEKNMSNIQIVGLTTGEQIVAKIELVGSVYTIKNPAIIVPVGKGELALAPWLPYSTVDQTGVQIHKDRITFTLTPQPELSNQYNTTFGNGLILPANNVTPALSLAE
jgi:hypothetical protein